MLMLAQMLKKGRAVQLFCTHIYIYVYIFSYFVYIYTYMYT